MTLLEIIKKRGVATQKVAAVATDKPGFSSCVAKVASVAVANPKSEKNALPENTPSNELPKATKNFTVSDIKKNLSTIRAWLTEIGEPEADHLIVLNKCRRDPEALMYFLEQATEHGREKRRQKVLKMLEENPNIRRAFATDTETDHDHVILTLAIRDTGTCELLIPRDKYDGFAVLEVINQTGVQ